MECTLSEVQKVLLSWILVGFLSHLYTVLPDSTSQLKLNIIIDQKYVSLMFPSRLAQTCMLFSHCFLSWTLISCRASGRFKVPFFSSFKTHSPFHKYWDKSLVILVDNSLKHSFIYWAPTGIHLTLSQYREWWTLGPYHAFFAVLDKVSWNIS